MADYYNKDNIKKYSILYVNLNKQEGKEPFSILQDCNTIFRFGIWLKKIN